MFDLQRFRKEKRISQTSIFEATGIRQSRISEYENGKWSKTTEDKLLEHYPDIQNYPISITQEIKSSYSPLNILHVPIPAQAGILSGDIDPITEQELTPFTIPGVSFDAYSFEVQGKSMMDTLDPGDIVIVTREPDTELSKITNEYIYVVDTNKGLYIKRIRKQNNLEAIWLVSDSQDFPDIDMKLSDIRGIHKVRRKIGWNLKPRMSELSE